MNSGFLPNSTKNEFVRSFFGRIRGYQKVLQFLQIYFIYFQKTSVDLEEDWDDIKIDDNPKVQAQIEDLSTENKSLAREVAFLKETIKVS